MPRLLNINSILKLCFVEKHTSSLLPLDIHLNNLTVTGVNFFKISKHLCCRSLNWTLKKGNKNKLCFEPASLCLLGRILVMNHTYLFYQTMLFFIWFPEFWLFEYPLVLP